ncbi:MAG: N-acetyltransferase [candidate division Zixibacteria bacterium]|nr:N-acetyltransferase [candidate division Zixibacteria bacterium]
MELAELRVVPAVSANKPLEESDEISRFADYLRDCFDKNELSNLYFQFEHAHGPLADLYRSLTLRAIIKSCGICLSIEPGVKFKHPETFEFGDGVFVGTNVFLQGRFDGEFKVGDRTWLGPNSYYDCRALEIGSYVGIGPGVKFLGSEHTGTPVEKPTVTTDLVIRKTKIADNVDIGTGAVILPGIKIGEGAIIGAGAVVNRDIPEYAVAAGVPARIIKSRINKSKQERCFGQGEK